MECKHKFIRLRESRRAGFSSYGESAIIQCEKCLKVFEIEGTTIKEIKFKEDKTED